MKIIKSAYKIIMAVIMFITWYMALNTIIYQPDESGLWNFIFFIIFAFIGVVAAIFIKQEEEED